MGFAAIASQFAFNVQNIDDYRPLNFFSFFTIESNIIAVAAFAIGGWYAWKGQSPRWLEFLRGGATMYMTITGIVYSLLLSNVQVDTAVPWINVVLHYTVPTVVVIDWLVDLPRRRISLKESLVFLAFPLLYLVYSLIRGPIADWYPYPFLDPRIDGYGNVAVMSVLIALVAFVLAVIMALSTRLQNTVPHPASVPATDQTAGQTAGGAAGQTGS
ncbi:Pr6Pr family membrane protein [Pseudarthrobacter sp. J75]|uniref:Pr6Pr family membrane protein n=1 Tax=unclassified Pseudarthrobacter TaxID=2647000 RepID=UPI002E8013B8|nr:MULTISPECIES: Pr6Pr family membrane protein [unclassified Pseudarthrobacter]MEE2522302.1 Pr6Pr family membrane protein [Pseudarthrobacter sp. J47]MEE2528052.1 Pr6Pr family membrane protein [Pseudarthrobacter sp. J75]